MDTSSDLRVLFESAYPIVFASTRDESGLLELIRAEAATRGVPVWVWSAASGLARDGFDAQYGTTALTTALAFVADTAGPATFVLADAGFEDPVALRSLKEAASGAAPGRTIVVTGPTHDIPDELDGAAVAWSHRPPSRSELARLVRRTIADLSQRGIAVTLGAKGEAALVDSLRGASLTAAERLIQQAVLDRCLDDEDVAAILRDKFAGLGDGVLELIETEERTLEAVGGLDGLKEWLRVRGTAFDSEQARDLGIEPPRGVLLTGIPGCGKSLSAKTLAATWQVPLLLLDPGRLYRKYVGESEQRLERALDAANAMSPAVLWIDEIEKGFATSSDGDGGVSTRVLGMFLRWLQDRPPGVFVVATANDVAALPPELLRKGRFDEVFFVDLPGAEARAAIAVGHLRARGHDPTRFDIDKIVDLTEGCSGAEIEAIVVGALYRAFAAKAELTTEELAAEAEALVPLSVTRAEDVAALRSWATGRTVPA